MSEAFAITQVLQTSNELSAFCTQNGWIISDSIAYEILERHSTVRCYFYGLVWTPAFFSAV